MNYKVYAIKYASSERQSSQNFYGSLDPHDNAPTLLNFFIWVAVSDEHTVVIDSGFSEQGAKERERSFDCHPVEALERLGFKANQVSDLIVSHLHWDHVGNSSYFTNARIIIQESEMAFWTGKFASKPGFRSLVQVEEVVHFVEENFKGRIHFVNGSEEILPGISVHKVGGHSPGLQVVCVKTEKGNVVLASDASHYYDNIKNNFPFSVVYNLAEMHDAFELVRSLTDNPDLIIPGHDPLVMEKFPAVSSELENIAVRLA